MRTGDTEPNRLLTAVPVLIAGLLVLSGGLAGTVAASSHGPEPVDSCADAPALEPGTYNSTVTPSDVDVFRVEGMSQGDYLSFDVEYDRRDISELRISGAELNRRYDDGYEVEYDPNVYAAEDKLSPRSDGWDTGAYLYGEPDGTGQLWLESDLEPCVAIRSAEDGAGAYTFSFSVNSAEPPSIPDPDRVSELEAQLQDRDERIEELETQLSERNATVERLEEQVTQQEQRITDLESTLEARNETVEELRSQLDEAGSDTGGSGDVTIEVDVSPGGEQERFVAGETAQVEVQTGNADPSEVQIEYGSATYDPGTDGQVEVALAEPGTKELAFVYGDTRESVSLDVQERSEGTDRNTPGTSAGEGTAADGPGFGVAASLVAVVSVALLGLRRGW
jgi:PGF-CTERM protein